MYIGHGRQCVCLSLATFPHYCTDPNVNWGNVRGCPVVVQYWADLQSVHGFRCYDNSTERKISECLYSLYIWLLYRVGLLTVLSGKSGILYCSLSSN